MTNPVTADRRHFEDLAIGETVPLGAVTITREMIVTFARAYDPLPFHLDEEAAKRSLLGGLAASGWQTAGLSLKLLVDAFLSKVASAGGLGFSDLKWKKPVLKGDTITGTATIASLRRSRSHPQWGIASIDLDIRNQRGVQVMTLTLANLIDTRHPETGTMATPQQPYDLEAGSASASPLGGDGASSASEGSPSKGSAR
jgi:acyl dehydratase